MTTIHNCMSRPGKFIKKPIPVAVEFARTSGQAKTLEGTVPYKTGDALLTGTAGELWPVPRDRFEETYEPVADLRMGEDGPYIKRPILVDAVQALSDTDITLKTHAAKLHANPGDWIITAQDGTRWVVAGDIFLNTYTAVEQSD